PMAQHNKTLGMFKLDGINPAPRGVPQIEVNFDIDVNGIVHVSALDKGTNKKQSITITNSSGLSDDEIDRMVKEAEENKEADIKRKEEAELKNNAEQFIHQINKSLEDENENVSPEQRAEVERLRDEMQEALDNDDMETLKTKLDALEQAAHAMSEQMYQQSQASEEAPDFDGPQDDNIVDADFTEKN
ncbi:MAG: Hsp70 family protein, partial [Erysipelothrix sp.]|nr:Hsp70 family protein [Erysipelothrix sp.]